MPKRCQLAGREHAAQEARQQIALASLQSPPVRGEQPVPDRRAAFDESVLCAFDAQLRGDPLAHAALAREHAQLGEEQRSVLKLEAAAQLILIEHRAIASEQMRASL